MMNQQITTDSSIQKVNPLESLLQVLSNFPSEIFLQEAATAEDATIDALITRFEEMSSILKQAKRQRKFKRKDYADSLLMEQQSLEQQSLNLNSKTLGNRAGMPTEVLRQLTQSGYLSTADLAKTLLLTCKCYVIDLGREYVYEHLCKSQWRNITKLPPSLLADRGYYWLFRNLSRGTCESREEVSPIPPPAFDYDAMLFSVSIRDERGKEIVSEILCGEQLETLKEDGSGGIVLERPIKIGTIPLASVEAYAEHGDRDEECRNWSVRVHLFRLDENKCCCVHESNSCDWVENLSHPLVGFVMSIASSPNLKLDEGGKLLEGRIQEFDRFSLPVEREERDRFQGIKFGVNLYCCGREQEHLQDDPSARTIALVFGEVRLEAHRVVDWTTDQLPELFINANEYHHSVALPHLLEHLKGWGQGD